MSKAATPPPIKFSPASWVDFGESLVSWVRLYALEIAIVAAIGALIYVALAALRSFAKRRAAKINDRTHLGHIAWRTLSRTTHLFMALVAARLLTGYALPPPAIERTVSFLFTVVAAFQAAIWLREIIVGMMLRRAAVAEGGDGGTLANAMGILKLLISVALFAIASIVVLDNIGVNVTALIAGLGIGGIGIGLAAQNIFSDLFAALSIIFDRPFRKGDSIQYDQTLGTVEYIGLKSTRIRATTGEQKIVSNNNLLSKEVTNFTRIFRRRARLEFGVIYQTPPDKARAIPAICREITKAEGHDFIRCVFVKFGPSSLDYIFDFDVMDDDFEVFSQARHAIGLALLDRFNREGIEFAYPTQTTFTAAPDGTMVMPYATRTEPGE